MRSRLALFPLLAPLFAGCTMAGNPPPGTATPAPAAAISAAQPPLLGTEWRLIAFQSNSDAIGTIEADDRAEYSLRLDPGGGVNAQLYCNRGSGSWSSEDADSNRGSLRFGAMAATLALCPPSPLERFARDLGNVASFVIADGYLNLNLKVDAGTYRLAPVNRVSYRCERGGDLNVAFFAGRAEIRRGDEQPLMLRQQPTGSGFAYGSATHSLRGKGKEAQFTIGKMAPIACEARP